MFLKSLFSIDKPIYKDYNNCIKLQNEEFVCVFRDRFFFCVCIIPSQEISGLWKSDRYVRQNEVVQAYLHKKNILWQIEQERVMHK